MNDKNQNIKVLVADDSAYYNRMMTSQINNYLKLLELENQVSFELHSFSSYSEFMMNNDKDFDVAIIDFYLSKGSTGTEILEEIRKEREDCKAIVISNSRNIETAVQSKMDGFNEFVHKDDRFAMPRLCFFVEQAMQQKLSA